MTYLYNPIMVYKCALMNRILSLLLLLLCGRFVVAFTIEQMITTSTQSVVNNDDDGFQLKYGIPPNGEDLCVPPAAGELFGNRPTLFYCEQGYGVIANVPVVQFRFRLATLTPDITSDKFISDLQDKFSFATLAYFRSVAWPVLLAHQSELNLTRRGMELTQSELNLTRWYVGKEGKMEKKGKEKKDENEEKEGKEGASGAQLPACEQGRWMMQWSKGYTSAWAKAGLVRGAPDGVCNEIFGKINWKWEGESTIDWGLILGLSFGGVFLLFLVCCCFCRKSAHRQQQQGNGTDPLLPQ